MEYLLSFQDQYAFLGIELFGNTIFQYIALAVAFVLTYTILKIFRSRVVKNLHKFSERTKSDFDDLIVQILESLSGLFYFFVSLAVGVQFITQPAIVKQGVFYFALIVVVYTIVRALQKVVEFVLERGVKKRIEEDPRFDDSVVRVMGSVIKVIMWLIAILLVLQNLGYNITALMAGLGIGGLAIAFALQNVLGDIFASFSIYMDRPFQTGDFIIVGDHMGTVRHIGIKSTRIQSLSGEEIVIPNKELTETRVRNYKAMERRRIVYKFGVTYQTPVAKVKKIPAMVEKIFTDLGDEAELSRVHFNEFGDSSLNFEVVYHVNDSEYGLYMDLQEKANLALMERFEKEGIEFAYPTQTVYLQNSGN